MKTKILTLLFVFAACSSFAQKFYGNVIPADSGTLDLGRNTLRWDTIFVDNIYPPVAGSGIWEEANDSTIRWSFGGDTVFFYISNGVVRLGSDAALYFGVKGNNAYIFNGTTATAAELRLNEDTDNGTNFVSWKSPASIAANVTLTLPDNDGTGTQYLTTNGSGVLSWSSASAISPFTTDGGSDVFLNDSTDKVGIGISQPTAKLHVKGDDGVLFESEDGNTYMSMPVDGVVLTVGTSQIDIRSDHIDINQESGGEIRITGNIVPKDTTVGVTNIGNRHAYFDTLFTNSISLTDTLAPQAQTATLTNFPAGTAGNPTGFVNVLINGVIRKMPYW